MRLPKSLPQLADGTYLWSPTPSGEPTWGLANCVLVADRDQAALVDTPYDPHMTQALKDAAARVLPPGVHVTTVVNTHPNGDHTFGNQGFPGAEIVSTRAHADHLCAEPDPRAMHHLTHDTDPQDPVGWYMRRHFGRFDYSSSVVVPPTTTFSGSHRLQVGDTVADLIEVGPAHTAGDLIVHLPRQRVVCAGDVVFAGDHPVHWAGPLGRVVAACETILDLEPETIVPGHGPVMGPDGLRSYAAYLRELRDRTHAAHAAGRGAVEAAEGIIASGFAAELGMPERVLILTAVEYRHLAGSDEEPDVLALAGAAAHWAFAHRDDADADADADADTDTATGADDDGAGD